MLSLSPLLFSFQMLSRNLWGLFAAGVAGAATMLFATAVYAFRLKRVARGPSHVGTGTTEGLRAFEACVRARDTPTLSGPGDGQREMKEGEPGSPGTYFDPIHRRETESGRPRSPAALDLALGPMAAGPPGTSRRRPHKGVPLTNENIDPTLEAALAARTHHVTHHQLPPLNMTTAWRPAVESTSFLLYPPLVTDPAPIVWLPRDALSAEEALDSSRFWNLDATYAEAVPLETLLQSRHGRRRAAQPQVSPRS
jgi:hypothetical protein